MARDMRVAALVIAASMAHGGCASYRAVKGGGALLAGVGTGTAALAGLMCLPYAFPAPQDEDPNKDANLAVCRNMALAGALMVAVGIPLFVYGGGGVANALAEKRIADARQYAALEAEHEERARVTRERVWASTREAASAARAGDCGAVLVRARYVSNLDPPFFAAVFARDAAIKMCLPTPAPPRDRIKDRERAFALLKAATTAARAGDCTAAVSNVEATIRELDANVHDAWFVRDTAIKACLGSTPDTPSRPAAEAAP